MTSENRKTIFKEELKHLRDENYLDENSYSLVSKAYDHYYESVLEKNKLEQQRQKELQEAKREEARKIEEKRQELLRLQKEAKKRTPEQIRERNISLSLLAGVILLLIGGLVLATSSWEKMNNILKVISIGGVSVLFFGISYVTRTYLKIEKTAFAFLTLASLLIPITFIGIGYFQLFGPWLSLFGGGRYVLGLLATSTCLPLYSWIALKHNHRLFSWLSLLTLSAFMAFLFSALRLQVDLFYFALIAYNGLLLLVYHFFKDHKKVTLFIKELPLFTQANLIISSFFILVFFENQFLYSVNILLTACLYIAIVFVYNKKEFHYVFTFLFIYGMYQLLENAWLAPLNYIGFASIGILYLALQQRITDFVLKKVFTLTSGVVSGLAFFYISFEGLVVLADRSSVVLLLAYLIIALNYLYLAFLTKRPLFQYLAPVFFIAFGYQSWNLLSTLFRVGFFESYMFLIGVIMLFVFFLKNKNKYILPIKQSSFYSSIATMLLSIATSLLVEKFLQLSILLIVFGFILMVIHKHQPRFREVSLWSLPISWLFALIFIYVEFAFHESFYNTHIGLIGHLALSSLVIIGIGFFFTRINIKFRKPTVTVGMIAYSLSMVSSLVDGNMSSIVQSCLYFIGIFVYIITVYEIKKPMFWSFVAITFTFFWLSLIRPFELQMNFGILVFWLVLAPVFLLVVYEVIGRKIKELKPYFYWVAHVLTGIFIVVSVGLYFIKPFMPVAFLITFVIYGYSLLKEEKESAKKLFLYMGLTMIPLNSVIFLDFFVPSVGYERGLAFSIFVIGLIWKLTELQWREKIDLFILPLSFIALINLVTVYPMLALDLLVTILIASFTIYVLWKRKWDVFAIVPLLFASIAFFDVTTYLPQLGQLVALIAMIFTLQFIGLKLYPFLLIKKESYDIDWFTLLTPFVLLQISETIGYDAPLWQQLIPSLLLVYLLFMQVKRMPSKVQQKAMMTAAVASLLQPYYLVLDFIYVPALIEMEMIVLPFLALTIFLTKKTWAGTNRFVKHLQSVVLVIVTTFIVFDALESNLIYDALIVGGLALLSIIAGMHYRIRSYFFVGLAVLLLNVFLQTRPFWGNLPWWMYLIFGGATLIGFASFYEWQKQKPTANGKTKLQEKKEKLLKSFKEWE